MNLIKDKGIFVIAEIAQSYEGDFDIITKLIEKLQKTIVDGIMFQVVYADELALPENNNYDFFKKLEFTKDQWHEVISMIHESNKIAIGECFGVNSASILYKLGIDAFKIHPADLANISFLQYVSKLNIPLLIGIGGAFEEEIEIALQELKEGNNSEIVLLHGYQLCPTAIKDSHLMKLRALSKRFGLPVGYSDHVAGSVDKNYSIKNDAANILPLLCLATGAQIIEKHVILDRSKAWEDYESALTPEELNEFIALLHTFTSSLGSENCSLNKAELNYRETSRKYIVSNKNLKKGYVLTINDISLKRIANPQDGIVNSKDVIGKKLLNSVSFNNPITINNLEV
ncbi:MAG: N-acetylneuraminate synthase family protein [Parcubacteria group bacterium]|nr:N-acetylneuraminate synthase family protein [Parcubacteria group bacterium]